MMFGKRHEDMEYVIKALNELDDRIISVVMALGRIDTAMKKIEEKLTEMDKTLAMLQEIRAGSEIEVGLENIMNYSGRVKKHE